MIPCERFATRLPQVVVHLYGWQTSETSGRKSDRSFEDCEMRRARGIPTLIVASHHTLFTPAQCDHRRKQRAFIFTGESTRETQAENVLASNANGPSAVARARRAENYLSSRDERKLFNRVSCSGRRRIPSHLRVAASLRGFYFRPFVPGARPAGTNRRHRRNLDCGEAQPSRIDLFTLF